MLMQPQIEHFANELLAAERTRTTITPFTERMSLSISDGYRIQAAVAAMKDEPLVGYKLGYTSQAMRQQMGIDEPNFGRLTAPMQITDGIVPISQLIHPRVEPEIAIQIGQPPQYWGEDSHLTLEMVREAVQFVYPALEIVDTRYHEYRFKAPDNIADNSSSARFVLGEPIKLNDINLKEVKVVLSKSWNDDGRKRQAQEDGIGADAMGDPLLALLWLVKRLARDGKSLAADSIILTGGLTRAPIAQAGDLFVGEFGGLGTVQALFQ